MQGPERTLYSAAERADAIVLARAGALHREHDGLWGRPKIGLSGHIEMQVEHTLKDATGRMPRSFFVAGGLAAEPMHAVIDFSTPRVICAQFTVEPGRLYLLFVALDDDTVDWLWSTTTARLNAPVESAAAAASGRRGALPRDPKPAVGASQGSAPYLAPGELAARRSARSAAERSGEPLGR